MITTTNKKLALPAPAAESARPHAPRVHTTWSPGDKAHQGDLILVGLSALPPSAMDRRDRQMADGSSPGARHVVEGGTVFDAEKHEIVRALKVLGLNVDEQYIGPVFAGPCTLTHPTHAHQVFPDNTVTAVVYQRNLDAEEREMRARD